MRFEKARPLEDDDIEQVLWDIALRLRRLLKRWNYLNTDGFEPDCVLSSSIKQTIAFGERAGEPVRRMKHHSDFDFSFSPRKKKRLCITSEGFSLHAGVRVRSGERHQLESLIRYMARPSILEKQLEVRDDGSIQLNLRKPWHDGTEALISTPHEFIEKLACLVPRPYKNLVVYFGCFAPCSKIHHKVFKKNRSDKAKCIIRS